MAGASGLKVVVLASRWHTTVMDGLLAGAERALAESGVSDVTVIRVAGAYELPVAASRVAHSGVDAMVALGVVIRGGTPHFEYVCGAATDGLTQVSVSTGIPIGSACSPATTTSRPWTGRGCPIPRRTRATRLPRRRWLPPSRWPTTRAADHRVAAG